MAPKTDTAKLTKKRLLALSLAIVLLLLLGSAWWWQNNRLQTARYNALNPAVFIETPSQGTAGTAGAWIPVLASATGPRLVESIELWVNGELIETQHSGLTGGVGVIYGQFFILLQEGAQTLVVRAVDADGYVGQSEPVSISGFEDADYEESSFLVPYASDMDLEVIANDYQVPIESIIERNEEQLSLPEGLLNIPLSPAEENLPLSPEQVPPDLIAQNGFVSGKLCYPSQYIPAMTAYFENIDSGLVTSLGIAENQNSFSISLPEGKYIAYAWLPDFSLGGSYSQAVLCGLTTNCTDHAPVIIQMTPGACTKDVDICDWYDQTSVPQLPNSPAGPPGPAEPSVVTDIPMLTPQQVFPASNSASLPFALAVPSGPPDAPMELNVRANGCTVRVGWNNPQTQPAKYAIWLSSQTGSKQLVATLKPGSSAYQNSWYEFTSPEAGLITVWVDAINAVGSSSSNPDSLTLPENCSKKMDDDLKLEALELQVADGYDQVYLYLSVEGVPEERLPSDDSIFFPVENGTANLSLKPTGENLISIPKPKDNILNIEGECWGWSGGNPIKISSFSESIPESSWSDFHKTVGNHKCLVDLDLKPKEPDFNSFKTIADPAPGLPAPFNVRSKLVPIPGIYIPGVTDPIYYDFYREIHWQWKGNIKDITGFSIYHNKKLIAKAPANVRNSLIILPANCGVDINWQVVANGKNGQSPPSPVTIEAMGDCPLFAEVVFDNIFLYESCDSCCCDWLYPQPFDYLETYFFLQVNDTTNQVGTKNFVISMRKGGYYFDWLTSNSGKNHFKLGFSKAPISLNISTIFYDVDDWSGQDAFGKHYETYTFKTFQEALNAFGNSQGTYQPQGVYRKSALSVTDTAEDHIWYRIWFYKGY